MKEVFNKDGLKIVQTETLLSVFCEDELIVEAKIGGTTVCVRKKDWSGYVEYYSSKGLRQFKVALGLPGNEKCFFEHGEGQRERRVPPRYEEVSPLTS